MSMSKMKKMVVSLAAVLAFTASASLPTFAANTSDSALPTKFISYTQNATTEVRSKTNTTPCYVNNTSGMTLWVYANAGSKPSNVSATYNTGTTVGGFTKVLPGKYVVHSTIYEKGYRTAWLNISTGTSSVSGTCKGYWSPDTAGSYPSAN